jgi:AraC-like DNA-binding protein
MPGPIQTVEYESSPGRWRFSSAAPDEGLVGIVLEYWEVEGRLSPFRERILPNGCTEIMVNLGPPHQLMTHGGTSVWERAWFSGLHERAIVIESLQGTHLVSARLHPLGALRLFGPDVPKNVNAVIDLECLLGAPARELRALLLAAESTEVRFDRLARLIETSHGNLRVTSVHLDLGVSRKQLWLRFARDLGMSARAYAQLQRFVWTLARLRESTSVDWPRLAAEAGYSDQAHLARDFRRVASASPTEFLRVRSPDTTALLDDVG